MARVAPPPYVLARDPIALGKQGAMSSPLGFGAMEIGVTLIGGKDLYGKKALSRAGVTPTEMLEKTGSLL